LEQKSLKSNELKKKSAMVTSIKQSSLFKRHLFLS